MWMQQSRLQTTLSAAAVAAGVVLPDLAGHAVLTPNHRRHRFPADVLASCPAAAAAAASVYAVFAAGAVVYAVHAQYMGADVLVAYLRKVAVGEVHAAGCCCCCKSGSCCIEPACQSAPAAAAAAAMSAPADGMLGRGDSGIGSDA